MTRSFSPRQLPELHTCLMVGMGSEDLWGNPEAFRLDPQFGLNN
jgi:hypothetical protein